MKRYYVVLEVEEESDQLDPHEMATWVAGAVGRCADGDIGVTVYESAAGLYFAEANEEAQ